MPDMELESKGGTDQLGPSPSSPLEDTALTKQSPESVYDDTAEVSEEWEYFIQQLAIAISTGKVRPSHLREWSQRLKTESSVDENLFVHQTGLRGETGTLSTYESSDFLRGNIYSVGNQHFETSKSIGNKDTIPESVEEKTEATTQPMRAPKFAQTASIILALVAGYFAIIATGSQYSGIASYLLPIFMVLTVLFMIFEHVKLSIETPAGR